MGDLAPELAALLDHHRALGGDPAQTALHDARERERAIMDREVRWLSAPRSAKILAEELGRLSESEGVSAAVFLLARVSEGRFRPQSVTGAISPPAALTAVRKVRPTFEVADLRLLLSLDSAQLAAAPEARIEYLGTILDRAGQLKREGGKGAISVIDEVGALVTKWRPTGLPNRDHVRLQKLRDQASELSGQPAANLVHATPVDASDGFGAAALDALGRAPWPSGVAALLTHVGSASSSAPSSSWELRFVALAQHVDRASDLVQSLLEILTTAPPALAIKYREPQPVLLDSNSDLARGLVWGAAIFDEPWAPRLLQRIAIKCLDESRGRSVRSVTIRGEKVPFACFYALGRIAGPKAIGILSEFIQTTDNRTVLKRVEGVLAAIATQGGLTLEQRLEKHVPDHDLDTAGKRHLVTSDGAAVIRLDDHAGAVLTWLSEPNIQSVELREISGGAAKVANLFTEIKRASKAERKRIEVLLVSDGERPAEMFFRNYVGHPLSGWYGRRLLWTARWGGESHTGLPLQRDTLGLLTLSGETLPLPPEAMVSLWHPAVSGDEDANAARRLVAEVEVIQPFRQAWREVYRRDEFEVFSTGLYSDRFAPTSCVVTSSTRYRRPAAGSPTTYRPTGMEDKRRMLAETSQKQEYGPYGSSQFSTMSGLKSIRACRSLIARTSHRSPGERPSRYRSKRSPLASSPKP